MEPHLLPSNIGRNVNVKNDPLVRRRIEACGFSLVHLTPRVATYRRDFPNGTLCTFGYDPLTDTDA